MTNSSTNLVRRFYLEMTEKPPGLNTERPKNVEVIRADCPTVEFYRLLNKKVGGDLGWTDRQVMDDDELREIICDPQIEIWVIYHDGAAAGYAEINRRRADEIHLDYFGLGREFRGKGLGKIFLHWTIDKVWDYAPQKFKLHTNERDHPNALPNYLKAGFRIAEEKLER